MANYGMGSILSDAIFLFSKNNLLILCPLKSFKTHVLCQTDMTRQKYLFEQYSCRSLDMSVSLSFSIDF